jgi:hypothetical protein
MECIFKIHGFKKTTFLIQNKYNYMLLGGIGDQLYYRLLDLEILLQQVHIKLM